MENNSFYMVFLEGERTPTHKHTTRDSAEIEAMRLSKTYNKKAVVLCSIKSFEPIKEFTITDMRPSSDDLPF